MPTSVAELTIRPATRADVPTLFRLVQALADYEHLTHAVTGNVSALEEHLFGDRACIEAILAEQGSKPIGFALFFSNYSLIAAKPGFFLEDLFVLPNHRGVGVGKALLAHLAQLAWERGYGQLDWAVLDWNAPAIAFYKRMGAVIDDNRRICRLTQEVMPHLAAQRSVNPDWGVRLARPDDVPALIQQLQAWSLSKRGSAVSGAISSEVLHEHLFGAHPYLEGVLLEEGGTLAGWMPLTQTYSTFLTRPGLLIGEGVWHPDYSPLQGYKVLLPALAQLALDRQYGRIEWDVMSQDQAGIALYQDMGATLLDDWRLCHVSEAVIPEVMNRSKT